MEMESRTSLINIRETSNSLERSSAYGNFEDREVRKRSDQDSIEFASEILPQNIYFSENGSNGIVISSTDNETKFLSAEDLPGENVPSFCQIL